MHPLDKSHTLANYEILRRHAANAQEPAFDAELRGARASAAHRAYHVAIGALRLFTPRGGEWPR